MPYLPSFELMGTPEDDDQLDLGTPGASARREYQRRKANREQRAREKHPRIGRLILALQDDPTHERAWAQGARGEERVAKSLAKYLDDSVRVLHDRRIPRTRANIDHLAVAASGVWVIDSKCYDGKAEIGKPLFGPSKLLIRGRDQSKLVDALVAQVEVVRASLAHVLPEVAIHGALCFVDTKLPTVGTLTFKGMSLLHPRRLAKRINANGPLAPDDTDVVLRALADAFPRA